MKNKVIGIFMVFVSLWFVQCDEVLEKELLDSISEEAVWDDEALTTAYVNRFYEVGLVGWPTNTANDSDDASNGAGGDYIFGRITSESVDVWRYDAIRSINILLQDIDSGSLSDDFKNSMKAQAYFFRAYEYWKMVRTYGGVPLVLRPLNRTDDLELPRNATSECIAQIISDLDAAAASLPQSTTGDIGGRLTRGAALALKGRILLHYASEQFTPSQSNARWQDAYDANKAALTALEADGHELFGDFNTIFLNELNKEAILVTRYAEGPNGKTHVHHACNRPRTYGQNCTGGNPITTSLRDAFPMQSGVNIDEAGSGYDPVHYWLNRDPRFYATIAYNGSVWELNGEGGRIQWNHEGQEFDTPYSGYYNRKASNPDLSPAETATGGTDWIEIRLAEVILNLAEAANEIGQTDEAYQLLYRLRERAGVDAGTGNYGITSGLSTNDLRDAILLERRIEMAFEGKRTQDLRRRNLYPALNGTKRMGTLVLLNDGTTIEQLEGLIASGSVDLDTDYATYFTDSAEELDLGEVVITVPDNYDFFAIPSRHTQTNGNLEQTAGWGGTFDPFQ